MAPVTAERCERCGKVRAGRLSAVRRSRPVGHDVLTPTASDGHELFLAALAVSAHKADRRDLVVD